MDALEPGTLRAAMAWKGFSSAVATAIPMTSKIIPIKMIPRRIKKAVTMPLRSMTSSEISEISPETTMVTKKMVITQRICLLRSFFAAAGSVLDTFVRLLFFDIIKMMTAADRINLTA